MLSTWGGDGFDTISESELKTVGYETCSKYCSEYCWHHGMGYCANCAYDKERTKRQIGKKVRNDE